MEGSGLPPAEETKKPEPVQEAPAAPAKKLEEPGATAKNISTELSRKEALAAPGEGPAVSPPPARIPKSELPKESLATAVKKPEERGGAAKDSLVEPSRTGIPQAPLEGLAASALAVGRKSEPPKEGAVAGAKRPEERGGAAKESLVEPSRRIGPPEARESPAAFPPEVKRKPEPMKGGPAPSIQDRSLPPREAKIPAPSSIQAATTREAEVKQFLARYTDRYNRKDIDGFISFFSPKAVQNQKEDIEKIRKVYATFFQQNEELRYKVSNVKIEPHKDGLRVMADYELEGVLKKGRERKVWKGQVRWVLMKEEGVLKVLSLDYQPQKSRD
ncbi:MAG: nuclear transport factor 2 family protein [Syntrophaceae bacterium]|nr:nuclear transport factor 2 family protein [Syntrophaceae bacterium]